MADRTPKQVRQDFADHIHTNMGSLAVPWRESRLAFEVFPGETGDTRQIAHLAYAVGLGPTVPLSGDRQKRAFGSWVRTTVRVRFSHAIKADDQVGSYSAALGEELELVKVLMGTVHADLRVVWNGVTDRRVLNSGALYIGEVELEVQHRYTLQ